MLVLDSSFNITGRFHGVNGNSADLILKMQGVLENLYDLFIASIAGVLAFRQFAFVWFASEQYSHALCLIRRDPSGSTFPIRVTRTYLWALLRLGRCEFWKWSTMFDNSPLKIRKGFVLIDNPATGAANKVILGDYFAFHRVKVFDFLFQCIQIANHAIIYMCGWHKLRHFVHFRTKHSMKNKVSRWNQISHTKYKPPQISLEKGIGAHVMQSGITAAHVFSATKTTTDIRPRASVLHVAPDTHKHTIKLARAYWLAISWVKFVLSAQIQNR